MKPILPPDALLMNDGVHARLPNGEIVRLSDYDTEDYIGRSVVADPNRTWGDIQRQNAANAKEVGINAGIGGAAKAVQVGLGAIDTAQDTRNDERLAALESAEKRGTLGLTADERAQAEATVLNPARRLAEQANARTGQQLAGMGGSSLAQQQALAEGNQRAAQDAAIRGGIAINQANIDARREQEQELENRIAYKAKRQAATIGGFSQAIGELAQMGGKVAAAQAVKREPTDADLAKWAEGKPGTAGMDEQDRRDLWREEQKYEKQKARGFDIGAGPVKKQKKLDADGFPDPDDDFVDAGASTPYGG